MKKEEWLAAAIEMGISPHTHHSLLPSAIAKVADTAREHPDIKGNEADLCWSVMEQMKSDDPWWTDPQASWLVSIVRKYRRKPQPGRLD